MKIIKSIGTFLLLMCVCLSTAVVTASADSPKAITNLQELRNIENDPDGNYYLANDIIVSESDGEFSTLFGEVDHFNGVLDGRGHSIVGINITAVKSESGSSSFAGIVAYNSGTIKNLNIENAVILNADTNYAFTGIIAGINSGLIENCYVSGSSTNNNIEATAYTGGICGEMRKGEINKCVSYATIYSNGGEQYTGGIAGYCEKGIIKQCASYGSVFANGVDMSMDAYGGGIVGISRKDTVVKDCLFGGGVIVEKTANSYLGGVSGLTYGEVDGFISYGTLTPSEIFSHIYIGGAVGMDSNATVKNAYHLEGTINEDITGKKSEELTAEEFKNASSFGGIDFGSVWGISDGKVILKGMPKPGPRDVLSKLTGIKIVNLPKKLDYVQGYPALDLTGLKVSAIYTDKTVELKQNEYTVGGYNYVIDGKQTITISYLGFTTSFDINVKETDALVILPSSGTEGSYQEGNSTGKETNKKPVVSNTEKDNVDSSTSDKNNTVSNSSQVSSGSVVIGGNVIKDTLEDNSAVSDSSNSSKTEVNESDIVNTVGGNNQQDGLTSNNKNPLDGDDKGSNPVITIVLIVLLLAVIAAAIIWLILKFKSKNFQNEVSNDELKEAEFDENDVYNK